MSFILPPISWLLSLLAMTPMPLSAFGLSWTSLINVKAPMSRCLLLNNGL